MKLKAAVKTSLAGVTVISTAFGVMVSPAYADTRGQDMSKWQGNYNVSILEDFGILKVSGSDIGYNYLDPMFKRKAPQVRASGKDLGFYYYNGYAYPVSAANFFVDNLVSYRHGDPLVYDAEESRFVSPASVMAWVQQVRNRLGGDANMYVYMSSSTTRAYNWSAVAASGVKLWVANYGRNDGGYHGSPSIGYWNQWYIHQYTSMGRRSGYSGNLDMNIARTGAWSNGSSTNTVPVNPGATSTVPHGSYLGFDIAQTQRLLNARGYQLAVDGYYGPETRNAVIDYQRRNGLNADGYAGTATQASLNGRSYSPVVSVPYGTYLGYSVSQTQSLLNAKGYRVSVDSYYGPGTRDAVRKYQSDHGLSADGYAGPSTQASLRGSTVPHGTYLGYSVSNTQTMLRRHGYRVSVDGYYGPGTRSAVSSFQRASGLRVDGYAGPATQNRLRSSARVWTVGKGQTLSYIAGRLGVSVAHLQVVNRITNPNLIHVGETLRY